MSLETAHRADPDSEARHVDDEEFAAGDTRTQAYSLGRILAISDGVFAFALTLLVVQLAVPATGAGESLGSRLVDLYPAYFSYALSFAAIALTWTGHHETFKHIRRVDGHLISLNFGWLLLIALLPFPTAVLGRFGHESVAAILYAAVMSLVGLASTATWWYATSGHRLVSPNLGDQLVRGRYLTILSVPAVFLSSIPIALWRPEVAELAWTVFWVIYFVALRRPLQRLAARGS